MTAHDFVKNYYMHDSLIDNIEVLDNGRTIVFWVDFSYFMQEEYKDGDPDTGTLKITFCDVSDYSIPENVNWEDTSILDSFDLGQKVKFNIVNDDTDDFIEVIICSNRILVEAVDPS